MLKQTLAANALFSATSGIVLITARDWLAQHIPLPGPAWIALGAGLLLFATQLLLMLRFPRLRQKSTPQVVAADFVWVFASFVAMMIGWSSITAAGMAMIVSVNVVVLTLGLLQRSAFRADKEPGSNRSS